MSEQHGGGWTPGPWTIDDIDEGEAIKVSGKDGVAVTSVYNFLDFPCLDESEHASTHAEAVANARLIAAAPALLEALGDAAAVLALTAEQLQLWARESPDGPAMRRKADLLAEQAVALRDLIARAKGGA